jgi:antitoxin (DNA-binding transcriptional repressor) of toxin-antitoxin stability system
MIVNTITEAKASLSSLIKRVQNGEEVVIKKAGIPVAVIHKYVENSAQRVPGALAGRIRIASDFDKLPRDIARAFGLED